MVAVVLRHVQDLVPYYSCFSKVAKMLVKVFVLISIYIDVFLSCSMSKFSSYDRFFSYFGFEIGKLQTSSD